MKTAELLVLAALASTPDVEATTPQSPTIKKEMPAPNQPLCGQLDHMKSFLFSTYGEQPFVEMISTRYVVALVMFVNPQTSTWTVLAYDKAENKACLIDVGIGLKPASEVAK